MRRMFTREELYELVWTEPVSRLGARLGISGVALGKSCRRHGIPLPPRGYWAKLKVGKQSTRPPLPARGLGMPERIGDQRARFGFYEEQRKDLLTMEIPPPPAFEEPLSDLTERVGRLVGKVSMPKNFGKAHPLIQKMLEEDEVRRQKYLASRYPSSWDAPLFDSPFQRRRLRLVNAIFLALKRCDMRPSLRGKHDPEFGAQIGEEWVSFTLDSPKRADRNRSRSSEKLPSSEPLRMAIDDWRTREGASRIWQEKGKDTLDRHLEEIVVALIVTGELYYREGQLRQHRWLVESKARAVEKERKQREEAERQARERAEKAKKARIDRLLSEAAAFRQATDIRKYVTNVRQANAASEDPVPQSELDAWASWALAQADEIDPVLSRRFLVPQGDESEPNIDQKRAADDFDA